MRYIIPISGKDSLCTAIVQTRHEPDLPYEYMFNPTGFELPEVFDWLKNVEVYLRKPIIHIGRSLADVIKEQKYFLPSRRQRYCTRLSKIAPMLEFIGDDDANIYYGIRADEERPGFDSTSTPNATPVYPLKKYGISLEQVYQIINEAGLKPPTFFWKSMYDMVQARFGFDIRQRLPEWQFDMIFAWRSRANCDRCFNQRQYEIVGLWEHHPDRAEDALWYESQGSKYSWREKSFDWYRDNADAIKQKRANQIVKFLQSMFFIQQSLFHQFEMPDDGFLDIFKTTSCGLLCGK